MLLVPGLGWQDEAPCRGLPITLFVPHTEATTVRRKEVDNPPAVVTELCSNCPQQLACFRHGQATQSSGWWGGVLLHEGQIVRRGGRVTEERERRLKAAYGEPLLHFYAEMERDTDDCQLWPYGTSSGRGTLQINGVTHFVHQEACMLTHGPRPSRSMVAHQSCGQGLCFNGRHLSWRKQGGPTKLTVDQVREIRRLRDEEGVSSTALAEKFGIHAMTVNKIIRRLSWPEVTRVSDDGEP